MYKKENWQPKLTAKECFDKKTAEYIEQADQKILKLESNFEEIEYSDEEIENLQIGKWDMEELTGKVCDIIARYGEDGIFQRSGYTEFTFAIN